jgi:prepilin-type processing-associated H-X9-DG protein
LVVAVLLGALFVFVFLPSLRPSHTKAYARISCVNNLKQVGLACRIYSGDNNDRYPMDISTNDHPRVNEATPALAYFLQLQNELGVPKILTCPSDAQRRFVTNFNDLSSANISYFVGLDSDENSPQSILAGDRNITNGVAPKNNLLYLTKNQKVGFTDEIHNRQGNIALGDGSVQQVSSARLRSEILANSPFATNRIKLP